MTSAVEVDAYDLEADCGHYEQKQHTCSGHGQAEVLMCAALPTFLQMVVK